MTNGKLRVLVVEDEALVAMLIEDMLGDLGHEVVGTAGRVSVARDMAGTLDIDFAVVDLNLNGEHTYPVAAVLAERRIPFIFATGYGSAGLDDKWAGAQTLQKPFQPHELEDALRKAGDAA